MVDARINRKNEIAAALEAYESAVEEGNLPEAQLDDMFDAVVQMAPHSELNDLYFWGERTRTREEIIEEALRRENLWLSGGEMAVLLHILGQMTEVVEDPTSQELNRNCALQGLKYVSEKINKLRTGSAH